MKIKSYLKYIFHRHQDKSSNLVALRSGVKCFVVITILSAMQYFSEYPMVIAPFGASCILVFSTPKNNLAQPINIIGGYFITTFISILANIALPHEWWVIGLTLGVSIAIMSYLRVTHPPAGAIPLITYIEYESIDWYFLITPSLVGSITIVILAILMHKIPPSIKYPKKIK